MYRLIQIIFYTIFVFFNLCLKNIFFSVLLIKRKPLTLSTANKHFSLLPQQHFKSVKSSHPSRKGRLAVHPYPLHNDQNLSSL